MPHESDDTPEAESGGESSGGPEIEVIDIDELVDDLLDGLEDLLQEVVGETVDEVLKALILDPVRFLLTQLFQILPQILMHTPNVHPNSAVQEVHGELMPVALGFATVAATATGLLYITDGVFPLVSYEKLRATLPRIVIAVGFAAVSLPVLQLSVDLTNALTQGFAPDKLMFTETELSSVTFQLIILLAAKAVLLLVLIVAFAIRNVYLLFVAAISPLIAVAWAFPTSRKYADAFISGWWTALAMAPLDMLVLKFGLALAGSSGSIQALENWVYSLAAFTLMLLVPYHLYGASQAAIGQAYILSNGVKRSARRQVRDFRSSGSSRMDHSMRRSSRFGGESGSNKFGDFDWSENDD
ncbi:hypothetical protein ACFO0N_15145 [Halobium salinum]|uniref:Uncharacterized protein n=1 Tax=Halobium salinum TaxID=1364940 RepID=A0ABD5PET7_9EURY|nr:hypothetical protein [Halobium salinum]